MPASLRSDNTISKNNRVVVILSREVQSAVKKTKAWNSGQLTGLERCQADLEDDLEAIILTSYESIPSLNSTWEEGFF